MSSKANTILISCISLAIGYSLAFFGINTSKSKLQKVTDLVVTDYVDSLNYQNLENEIINDFLDDLDPHSVYLPPVKANGARQSLAGNYKGFGFVHKAINGKMHILKVIENSPADKAGLRVGDLISKVNNLIVDTLDNHYENAYALLKNAKIDTISFEIYRFLTKKKIVLNITKRKVNVPMVKHHMLDASTGYIKLGVFGTESHNKLEKSLVSLKKKGATKLILDLRSNGGGLVDEAIDIINEFVSDNKVLLAYTKGKKYKLTEYTSDGEGDFSKMKLVVLINKNSASASEITAGSLQDLDRALIIGDVSYGKGLVQKTFDFEDKSQLRLTIARYYLPSGRSIQKPYSGLYKKSKNDTFYSKNHHTLSSDGGIFPDIVIEDSVNCINLNTAIEFIIDGSEKGAQSLLDNYKCKASLQKANKYLKAAQLLMQGERLKGEKESLMNDVYIQKAMSSFKSDPFFKS